MANRGFSNKTIERICDILGFPVLFIDETLAIIAANSTVETFIGGKKEKYIKKLKLTEIFELDHDHVKKTIQENSRRKSSSIQFITKTIIGKRSQKHDMLLNISALSQYHCHVVSLFDLGRVQSERDMGTLKKVLDPQKYEIPSFRKFQQSIPIGICEFEYENERFIFVNDYLSRLSGYSKKELLSKPFTQIMTEESRNHYYERLRKIKRRKRVPESVEYEIQKKDGKTAWVLVNIYYEKFDGRFKGTGVLYEITERKEKESVVAQREKLLRVALEKMPFLLAARDESGKIIAWNDECVKVSGYSEDEVLRSPNIWEVLYPNEKCRSDILKKINKGGGFSDFITEIACKDGVTKTISWTNISSVYRIPGWHSWVIGIDITSMKAIEQDLMIRINKLSELVESREKRIRNKRMVIDSMSQEILENSQALSTLSKNIDLMKKKIEEQIISEMRKKFLPIIERLQKNIHLSHNKADLQMLREHLCSMEYDLPSTKKISRFLTPVEVQIAAMIKNDMNSREIADQLNVSVNTIKTHRKNIRKKLVPIPMISPCDSEGSRHPIPMQTARAFRLIPPPLVGA